ncbi:hypothetical protein LguiA_026873 [Lonicera macranthoides]
MLCLTNANPLCLDFCIYCSFEIDPSFFFEKLESNFPRIHPFSSSKALRTMPTLS